MLHLWLNFITFMVGITFMVFITFMGDTRAIRMRVFVKFSNFLIYLYCESKASEIFIRAQKCEEEDAVCRLH